MVFVHRLLLCPKSCALHSGLVDWKTLPRVWEGKGAVVYAPVLMHCATVQWCVPGRRYPRARGRSIYYFYSVMSHCCMAAGLWYSQVHSQRTLIPLWR